jgi:trk system potassium uptake protein TrkA
MAETINYQSILIISILAFMTPLLINAVRRVKIPYVVGEIIVGLVVGKSLLNLVHEIHRCCFVKPRPGNLMFSSGLEIDLSHFVSAGGGKGSHREF